MEVTARRAAILVTCLVVGALGATFAFNQWDQADRIATVASALAAVAALGVAVWAALPGNSPGHRAGNTGSATARGLGSRANSGVTGSSTIAGPAVADRTGDAQASNGGSANSGLNLHP